MNNSELTYTRSELCEIAGISGAQIDYLMRLRIVAPDVGVVRKSFSFHEARLTVIAGALLPYMKVEALRLPMEYLRERVTWPTDERPSLEEMKAVQAGIVEAEVEGGPQEWTVDEARVIHDACRFEMSCCGEADLFFQVASDSEGWRVRFSREMAKPDDVDTWITVDLRRLFQRVGNLRGA